MEKDKIKQCLLKRNYHAGTERVRMIEQCFNDLQPQWVSVDDRLPANTDQYLTMDEKGIFAVMTYSIQWGCFVGVAGTGSQVTHWQPKPLPPSEELNHEG
jgi:hypothetical protein